MGGWNGIKRIINQGRVTPATTTAYTAAAAATATIAAASAAGVCKTYSVCAVHYCSRLCTIAQLVRAARGATFCRRSAGYVR